MNDAKFGWKNKVLKSLYIRKSMANLMFSDKYARIQTFCPRTGPLTKMRIMLFYGSGEGPLTTKIKGAR